MELTSRQEKIIEIVRDEGPITGHTIADKLEVTRSTLRSDLAILTMIGVLEARPKVGYYYVGKSVSNPLADEIGKYTVRQVMGRPVGVTPKTSLYDTTIAMFTEDVGTLMVSDDGYLQGVVSRKDLLRSALGKSDPMKMPISMAMTPTSKVICCTPDDHVIQAAQRMVDYEVDCLPVVEEVEKTGKHKYKVVGRISKTTITKLFLEFGLQ